MIKTNLAVLMAERGLKIADVYEDTGISKTTLMSISENTGKGIQYETMDKLCNYFGISPREFFVYFPFRTSVSWFDDDKGLLETNGSSNSLSDLAITVKNSDIADTFIFNFVVIPGDSNRIPINYRGKADFGILMGNWRERQNTSMENGNHSFDFINDFIKKMPVQFFNDFRKKIDAKISSGVDYVTTFNGGIMLDEPNIGDIELKDGNEYRIYTNYSYDDETFIKDKIIKVKTSKLPF